jgi:hypothetical protein
MIDLICPSMNVQVRRRVALLAAAFGLMLSTVVFPAQSSVAQPLVIDASAATTDAPGPANYSFDAADAKSPDGHVLGVNAQYLTLDGKPWLPVMGEMHYSRVPEAEWESEILKMKSAGVQVVATYVIWIHHEEVEGQWDWAGQKDLRRFVELCARHGMYVLPRIGPWSHAEVRNGGFPDWLLAKTTQQRSNDPAYLGYVDTLYKQVGAQLKGLMWSEGGPVIAVQLENEYNKRCSLCGMQHILTLKQMARDAGLRVPFYTETGWDGAAIPKGAVLPVYGGYPDAPWDASIKPLKPSEVYAFRFGSRVTGDMGAVGGQVPTGNAANFTLDTPFITAEMGGGMQVTYHRRPVVSANDIAAMMPVMLGSGVNMYGSYMFHGGENPDGKLTTLQESLATHYANDLPQKSYDFEAPIGEFGDERQSLLVLKLWNYFLNDFGSDLAPMQTRRPELVPTGPRDLATPRISARTNGASGFLFVNNHVRGSQMLDHPNFQVAIKLPAGETLTLPEKPVTLPADSYFVWPFHMDLSGLHLRFATAQPLAILGTKDAPVYAFFAQLGIPAEFVIDDAPGLKLDPSVQSERRDGALWLHVNPTLPVDAQHKLRFTLPNGHRVQLLLLTEAVAVHGWKITTGDATELLHTGGDTFVDGDLATVEAYDRLQNLSAYLLPGDGSTLDVVSSTVKITRDGFLYSAALPTTAARMLPLTGTLTKIADAPAPLPAGFSPSSKPRMVAAAPTETDWARAAAWTIAIPKPEAGKPQFLRLHYTGDVARISVNGHLLADNFSDGREWLVGLERFESLLGPDRKLTISIYPLRKDAPIFFDTWLEPKFDAAHAASLQSVELLTQYTIKLKLVPQPKQKP